MTKEQQAHLNEITSTLTKRVKAKYERGQIEHGGNLWERPVFRDLIDETTDLNTYVGTLERQLREMHEVVWQCQAAISNGKTADALRLIGDLDTAFRLQLPNA